MSSKIIQARVKSGLLKKAKTKSKKMGMIKTNGEANLSQYLRYLIINDTSDQ